ncbi:MAG: serine hydrolase [Pseudomonadota bacterium]
MDIVNKNNALQDELAALVETIPGDVGLYAARLDSDASVAIDATSQFPTASSVKMFILFAALNMADLHRISLSERVEYDTRFSTPGSGVLTHLQPGLHLTVMDFATLMMMISDNTATNILIDYLGLDAINESLALIPLPDTRVGSWMDFKNSDRDSYSLGYSTPAEMGSFLSAIRGGALLSENSRERFWDTLRIQKYIEPLRRELPASPWAREWEHPEPVWVASKPGHLIDCTTETGLVHAHGVEWVISVMTRSMPREDPENDGERLISRASRLVFDAWSPEC